MDQESVQNKPSRRVVVCQALLGKVYQNSRFDLSCNNQSNFASIKRNAIRLLFFILIIILVIHLFILKIKIGSSSFFLLSKKQSTLPIHCIVYTNDRSGRFGNRMFMIASAYGIARLHSCHLYLPVEIIHEMKSVFALDLSPLLISSSIFNSINNSSSKPMTKITKTVVCQYILELTRPNAISEGTIFEIQGFWQSYLHFAKYGNELRERVFVSKMTVLEKVLKFFINLYKDKLDVKPQFTLENHQSFKRELTQSNRVTWIGIHVRRSDFIHLQFSSSDAYLLTAIEYYTSHYQNAHFIVASDDKSYCENLFRNRSNIYLTPQSFSTGDDLITLSLCEHSIITGGTFGWWIGYLANGQMIHDKVYPSGCERREYYYPPWFLIDGNVRAQKNTAYVL